MEQKGGIAPRRLGKAAELSVARQLGGRRTKIHGEAAIDVVAGHLALEVKRSKRWSKRELMAVDYARRHAPVGTLPGFVKIYPQERRKIISFDLRDYEDWHGTQCERSDNA